MVRPAAPPSPPRARLEPRHTLLSALGEGVAYLPRRSPNLHGWSSLVPGAVDHQTGAQLAVAGPIDYVACAGTVTPDALSLLADAGLRVEARVHAYRDLAEYSVLVSRLARSGFRLAVQRVHPEDETPPGASTVAPSLLGWLNDKGTLPHLVPSALLPRREVVETASLPAAGSLLSKGPVVLKAASRLPNGGGHCVWIARTVADVEAAREALAVERLAVVEEYLPIARTVSVHSIVAPDGATRFAGLAEEVVVDGRWKGNWLDADSDRVPEGLVDAGLSPARAGAAKGYRGVVGVDVAVLADGSLRVLDLNFRVNGSTAAVWLRPAIERARGARALRVKSWSDARGFDPLLATARRALARGALVPLCAYDPEACATGGLARLHGVLVGASRGEVEEEDRRLAAEGLA